MVDLSLEDASKQSRLAEYTAQFREDFTNVLFSTYVDKGILLDMTSIHVAGMYNDLLEQREDNQAYLDSFLQKSNTPWLAWIQDIHAGRFYEAYTNLMTVTDKEPVIEKKKVIFGPQLNHCLRF